MMRRLHKLCSTRTLSLRFNRSITPKQITLLSANQHSKRLLCTSKSDTEVTVDKVGSDSTDTGKKITDNEKDDLLLSKEEVTKSESNTVEEKKSPYRAEIIHPSTHNHSLPKHKRDINNPYDTSSFSSQSKTLPPNSTSSNSSHPSSTDHTIPPGSPPAHGTVWNYTVAMNNSIKDIEQSLMKRIHESNQRRFRLLFFGSLGAIIWFFVAFGETIGQKLKSMTTGLALETLEDKAIKVQTEELARAVVQTVLNDKDVTAQAASFLREASHAPETQEALLKLTLHVLKHPDSLKELSLLTKNVLAALSSDPDAIKHLAVLFSEVFQDPELKQHLNIVASDICKSPEVMAAASELTALVFREPIVQEAVNDILVEGSSNVMKNEEISVQSRQFVAEVMGDDSLQREGGDALWNSVYHAIVPGAIRYVPLPGMYPHLTTYYEYIHARERLRHLFSICCIA